MTARRTALASVVGAMAWLAACGGPGAAEPAPATAEGAGAATVDTVVIKNFTFQPATLTVAPGATVTVDNQDQAAHTVTAKDNGFDTGNIAGGARATFKAPGAAGNYPYLCTIHQYMTGTLVVK